MKIRKWASGHILSGIFGGKSKTPKLPPIEPSPQVVPVEEVTPVQQVSAKDEALSLQKQLAKRRRATLIAKGIENQPNIFRQKLGTSA